MIFQYTLTQVLSGQKTQTRRTIKENDVAIRGNHNQIEAVAANDRIKWQVGQTYAVQPGRGKPQVARIKIVQINSEYVSHISQADAIQEGHKNQEEFLSLWKKLYGEKSLDDKVWAIKFELVDNSIETPKT